MTTTKAKGIKIDDVGKGRADWYLFTELCKGCGLCITKCPINKKGDKCLEWSKEVGIYSTPAVQATQETCIACGTCELVCPDSAIRVEKKQQK